MAGRHDAVVVGSGPNGLAAAIEMARRGRRVLLIEGSGAIGGGLRSEPLTRPGFVHDVCSAVHPLAAASPFLRQLPLEPHGLEWVHPEIPMAHPFDSAPAALLHRDMEATAADLGADEHAYRRFAGPLVTDFDTLLAEILRPLVHLPRAPLLLARFGLSAIRSARGLAEGTFRTERARALLAGSAAHSNLPLTAPASASYGMVLNLAGHAIGWPMPRGGAASLARAMAGHLRELGGEIETGRWIRSWRDLPDAPIVLFDLTPHQLLRIGGDRLPPRYRRRLERYRYGPASFKVDYALSAPIPWRDARCASAGTVHLGGTLEEIMASEAEVGRGGHPERPFVLVTQPTQFDRSRAPEGGHVAWAYCHVPWRSGADMLPALEAQIERFAPGFRDCVLDRHVLDPAALEARNPNLVGGDINGGTGDLRQLVARPILSPVPYRIPVKGWYLCSSSTPPGGGVHGMCGYLAAEAALAGAKAAAGAGAGAG
ncbi:MAG: NAD(P)/FAD-dependent oxidoreductase [Gemmatimonadales bacterium]|nr:MAG: NAD(P)/FAD-dependent oxidoreductase [Gemmatimonadales bacterium]